ncbi:hypothetical protein [Shewanella marisflavi]|uniref:hypothetical protein n=1 Tax=Shewanella marisflavi TaxID=260364 RepID=UPI003AAC878D
MADTTAAQEKKVIHLINGRCGGNKTGYIVSQIESRLTENPNQCIIYAAPTKLVLNEVFSNRLINLAQNLKLKVTSEEEIKKSVNERITKIIENNYCGCLMITHSALFNLNEELLHNKLVIIDESPEQTISFSNVEFEETNKPNYLSKFEELTKIEESLPSKKYNRVTSSEENIPLLYQEARKLKYKSKLEADKGSTKLSNEIEAISKLYLAAASEHGYIYFSNSKTQQNTNCIYRSIDTNGISKVVSSAMDTWIASADYEYGLLNFILTNYHGIPTIRIEGTGIAETHNNSNVTILPLLSEEKNWSKTFYESERAVLDGYDYTGNNYYLVKTVFQELFEFGKHCISSEIYENNEDENSKALMFVNITKQQECNDKNFIQVSTQSHGQNNYRMHNHAIWMAGLVPNPHEFTTLNWFCTDVGINAEQARERLLHTRQYAPLYQGLARTSLRVDNSTNPNLFVVPDVSSAKSLLKWIPKATIEYSYVFNLNTSQTKNIDEIDERENNRRALAFGVFSDLLSKGNQTKQDIYDKKGVDRKKVSRLKNEFYNELSNAGLIAEESEEELAKEAYYLMKEKGLSKRKACEEVGLSRSKCTRILNKLDLFQ